MRKSSLSNPMFPSKTTVTGNSTSGQAGALVVYLRDRPEAELLELGVDRAVLDLARSEAGDVVANLAVASRYGVNGRCVR